MDSPKLGKLIDSEQQRDAVHIAIAPVVAAHVLRPGDAIGFKTDVVGLACNDNHIGIVDPFLTEIVQPGQRFWMFLYPGTITSLRHDWTHPDFSQALPESIPSATVLAAEQWLREFADRHDISYRTVIRAGHDWIENEEYYTQQGEESLRNDMYDPQIHAEFWKNFQIATGVEVPVEKRGQVFSCSC